MLLGNTRRDSEEPAPSAMHQHGARRSGRPVAQGQHRKAYEIVGHECE